MPPALNNLALYATVKAQEMDADSHTMINVAFRVATLGLGRAGRRKPRIVAVGKQP